MKKLLLTTAIIALTGLNQPAFAHGDEDHGNQPHETSTEAAIPATTAITSIGCSRLKMQSVKKRKKFLRERKNRPGKKRNLN